MLAKTVKIDSTSVTIDKNKKVCYNDTDNIVGSVQRSYRSFTCLLTAPRSCWVN